MRKSRRKSPLLALASDFDWLEIGTRIHYTHRAAVARYKQLIQGSKGTLSDSLRRNLTEEEESSLVGWKLVDGVISGENSPFQDKFDLSWEPIRFAFAKYPQARDKWGVPINKTVMIWPEDSFGWIIGRVRKGIGKAHASSYYSGGYYEPPEYDQGYFAVDIYVDLYVVKLYYQGTDHVYCPMWAVSKVEEA